MNSFKQNMFLWFCADLSSETQGQSVGSEEDFNHGRKSPGHRLSPDHFKTVTRMLAPDWAQKMLCITVLLCPIGKQHLLSSFRVCTQRLLSRHNYPVRSPGLWMQGKLLFSTFVTRNEGTTDDSGKRFGCYQQEHSNLHRQKILFLTDHKVL